MESKIFSYENDELKITWDQKKCIHAKECIHGSPSVFDITQKPWINPDNTSSLDELRRTIQACPSGALQYHLKNSDEVEQPSLKNTISIKENGPFYVNGDIQILNGDEEIIAKETRAALCRCGASSNKPFCDNSHLNVEFESDTNYNPERLELEPTEEFGGILTIKLNNNASILVTGNYELIGENNSTVTKKKMSYCRCGASSNKPFCDGSHKAAGFES